MFTIFDSKARVYMLPFYCPNVEVAQRHFARGVADPQQNIAHFPEDFSLWEIGVFDDQTAVLTPLVPIINHGPGTLYKMKEFKNGE